MSGDFATVDKEYHAYPSFELVKMSIIERITELNDLYYEIIKDILDQDIRKKNSKGKHEVAIDSGLVNRFRGKVISLFVMLRPKLMETNYNDMLKLFQDDAINVRNNAGGNLEQIERSLYKKYISQMSKYILYPTKMDVEQALDLFLFLQYFIEVLGVTKIEYMPNTMIKKTGGIKTLGENARKFR